MSPDTRSERAAHVPIPRYRAWAGWAVFSQVFRPFFLLAGIWAIASLVIWMHAFLGLVSFHASFDPFAWHAHEMLFGFAAAVLAGFLLTAIPNWTGRMPLQGWPLIALVALWCLGRIAMLAPFHPLAVTMLDLSFLLALLAVAAREILAGKNWRNAPLLAALAVLAAANALSHAEQAGWIANVDGHGTRLALAVFAALIGLVGGRVVPSFTRNWLVKAGAETLPAPFSTFDKAALAALVMALLVWVAAPESVAAGVLCVIAAALHGIRLARWRGRDTLREPLLAVLHLGYAWLAVAVLLLGLGALWPAAVPANASIHALTTGAMATMMLAVMARAIRGHTGNALTAGPATTAIFAAITCAAAIRVVTPWTTEIQTGLLMAASGFWVLAFALFVAVHARTLLTPYDPRA